jgi:hypothetical protein
MSHQRSALPDVAPRAGNNALTDSSGRTGPGYAFCVGRDVGHRVEWPAFKPRGIS